MDGKLSIFSPSSYGGGSCGYCGPPGQRSTTASSYTTGVDAYVLTCNTYQMMIDRGWRRSGTYCYKPDNRRSCCPQYTIRLEALNFTPTRTLRKVLYRWNRFVLEGSDGDKSMSGNVPGPSKSRNPKKIPIFSLLDAVHASEGSFCKEDAVPKHNFEVVLEPSCFTREKFELFSKYQATIHNDHRNSSGSFARFLVESPLTVEPIVYAKDPPPHLPRNYGSYHMLYRLDGKLIAVAILDILPKCVSSVYFMYDKKWEQYSFGKISAMREAALVREIYEHGVPDLRYLYLGYYIHSCQKMRYKADYSPSFLLDPVRYSWHPYEEAVPTLDNNHFACFANSDDSLKEKDDTPHNVRPLTEDDAAGILVLQGSNAVRPFLNSEGWEWEENREVLAEVSNAMGPELMAKSVFLVY